MTAGNEPANPLWLNKPGFLTEGCCAGMRLARKSAVQLLSEREGDYQ